MANTESKIILKVGSATVEYEGPARSIKTELPGLIDALTKLSKGKPKAATRAKAAPKAKPVAKATGRKPAAKAKPAAKPAGRKPAAKAKPAGRKPAAKAKPAVKTAGRKPAAKAKPAGRKPAAKPAGRKPAAKTKAAPAASKAAINAANATAKKLGAKSGPDLVMAAAAHLAVVDKKKIFSRKDLLGTMKNMTSVYTKTIGSNLSKYLTRLEKTGTFIASKTGYALSAAVHSDHKKKLG